MRSLYVIIAIMVLPVVAFPQQKDTDYNKVIQLPDRFFAQINKKSQAIRDKLERQTDHYLQKIIKQEQKIRRKLAKKDSTAAVELFGKVDAHYKQLSQLSGPVTENAPYIPFIDTLNTSLKFLQQNPQLLVNANGIKEKLQAGIGNMQALESGLQRAEAIKKILRLRQQFLQEKLQDLGFVKSIKKLNKQVYYYGQQVNEYKALLKQPAKIERKVIDLLSNTTLFQDFMHRNSQLASLFRLPGNDDSPLSGISYAALQTRGQVSGMIQQQIVSGGPNAQQQFQQQLQIGQAQLSQLKDKLLSSSATGGSGEGTMPDFKPNRQKTKSFKQRLELGTNLQSQKATSYFPVTTDVGLSLGYKLNDKSVVGIGASYKVGWGSGWNNIRVTHQGAGIRSFMDWKVKGSFWFSGGLEMNYRTVFNSIEELKNLTAWQQSGLIGLSKKYQVSKKMKGKMQLLWDVLSYQQIPRSQPFVFRVGYDLK